MKVKAVKSFATIYKTAMPGEIFNVESDQLATDLIEAGYVEPVEDKQNNKQLTAEEVEKAAAKAEKERLAAEKKAAAAAAKALTVETVMNYLRIDGNDETDLIAAILAAARQRAMSHTGLNSEELDKYEDIPLAILALCAELYDVRQSTIQGGAQMNPTTERILNAYSVNLL